MLNPIESAKRSAQPNSCLENNAAVMAHPGNKSTNSKPAAPRRNARPPNTRLPTSKITIPVKARKRLLRFIA
jgi:hypothetical protein